MVVDDELCWLHLTARDDEKVAEYKVWNLCRKYNWIGKTASRMKTKKLPGRSSRGKQPILQIC